MQAKQYFLGIDPGSQQTGWGIVAGKIGSLQYVASGCIVPPTSWSVAKRLAFIYREMVKIMIEYNPGSVGIEKVFMAKNARSALMLGQARGAILAAVDAPDGMLNEYSATSVKRTVTGSGSANKQTVQNVVRVILKLSPQIRTADEYDALAIAMTLLQRSTIQKRISTAMKKIENLKS